jgi:hypothetical protein
MMTMGGIDMKHGLRWQEFSRNEKYVIVNTGSNRPIFAIGFCSCYTEKSEAEKAAAIWNNYKTPSRCTVKVIEVTE